MHGSGNVIGSGNRNNSGLPENKRQGGKMSFDTNRPPRVKSPLGDSKSTQDSQVDSGFMSDLQPLSSSSLSSEEIGTKSTDFPSPTRTHSNEGHNETSKTCTTDYSDSGIDISDEIKISSLNLSTHSPTISSNVTSEAPSTSCQSSSLTESSRPRSKLAELSWPTSHIALLREIFKKDGDGDTQLHLAVVRGFVEVVCRITRLLPHQALLDIPNNSGRTALHLAVASGYVGLARHLIVCGASPVAKNRKGETPLHIACCSGDLAMVSSLTKQVTEREELIAMLLYSPTHTSGFLAADLYNYDGQTCIHTAAQHGHEQILQHLTLSGVDVNAKDRKCGRTALHLAVEGRNKSLVRFLVESCRAALNIQNYAGLTPYQLAVANKAEEISLLLEELGSFKDPLPPDFAAEDDLDYDDESSSFEVEEDPSWPVDDLRFAGGPQVPLIKCFNSIPVSTHGPINADQYL